MARPTPLTFNMTFAMSRIAAPGTFGGSTLAAGVGVKVTKGDKLLTLEAMKMQTTIYAPCDGLVEQIFVQVGETVESKDLLMRLREA